jgi:hypothetical protein
MTCQILLEINIVYGGHIFGTPDPTLPPPPPQGFMRPKPPQPRVKPDIGTDAQAGSIE